MTIKLQQIFSIRTCSNVHLLKSFTSSVKSCYFLYDMAVQRCRWEPFIRLLKLCQDSRFRWFLLLFCSLFIYFFVFYQINIFYNNLIYFIHSILFIHSLVWIRYLRVLRMPRKKELKKKWLHLLLIILRNYRKHSYKDYIWCGDYNYSL